jgi:hypothetical protein
MDSEFVEKLNSISAWHKSQDENEQAKFELEISTLEDGLVTLNSSRGKVTHKLRPLHELYSNEEVNSLDEDRRLSLLYAIEGAIKRFYEGEPELTDGAVIRALEKLTMKPEIFDDDDALLKRIRCELRLKLSANNYSRDEVRQALRKILGSAKRHNDREGRRGYLDFVMEYVP